MDWQRLKLLLAPPAWRALQASLRLESAPGAPGWPDGPLIFACLHRDILPALVHVRPRRPTLMVSDSPDGDILVRSLGQQYYRFVRGSTGEDGGRAFVRLRDCLEEGEAVGLAVDGPVGPYGQIRDGVLQLARLTGAVVIPLRAVPGRAFELKTWDRTIVPWPFSRVEMVTGAPLTVAADTAALDVPRETLARFFAEVGGPA